MPLCALGTSEVERYCVATKCAYIKQHGIRREECPNILHPADYYQGVPFPHCATHCAAVKYLGVGECESVCPLKFEADGTSKKHYNWRSEHIKLWGKEIWIVNNGLYCSKRLIINGGYRCSVHYHKIKHETFYVQSGVVYIEQRKNDGSVIFDGFLEPGDSIVVLPYDLHRFTGVTDSELLEISTLHIEEDSYRMAISDGLSELEYGNLKNKYKNQKTSPSK